MINNITNTTNHFCCLNSLLTFYIYTNLNCYKYNYRNTIEFISFLKYAIYNHDIFAIKYFVFFVYYVHFKNLEYLNIP